MRMSKREQATATAGRTNIEQVAVGMGIENTCTVMADNELEQLPLLAREPFLANEST